MENTNDNSPPPPTLPTKREPDNQAKPGGAGRLHLLAKTVLAGWEQNPDAWYQEFNEWRESLIGERPREEVGKRGAENWNLVSLGMLLAWGYFAEEPREVVEATPTTPASESDQLVLPWAVLGPDGAPVSEGKR